MLNIIVLGAPCSGKGTQSEKLASLFDLTHLSTGDHFRNEIRKGTVIGKLVQSYIDKGRLVPDDIVLKEIYRISTRSVSNKGVIFDGFPRTQHQALMLEKSLNKRKLNISVVLYIDVEESILLERMLKRCKNSDRSDDTVDILRKRIEIYKKETYPLLEHYKSKEKLIIVSGMSSVEDVFNNIAISCINYFNNRNINVV